MISLRTSPRIVFPTDYDVRHEEEASLRGYLAGVLVESAGQERYQVSFIDPIRLQQTLEDEASAGRPYFTEPGLIVVPEVTTKAVREAVQGLWEGDFFDHLKPLPTFDQSANAGNLGDVFKHACLISLFKRLEARGTNPITWIESHSGYASYDLALLKTKRKEWQPERKLSLEPLLSREWKNAGLRTLKEIILERGVYPGSPALALWFLPPGARLYFYDRNPLAIASIEQEAERSQRNAFALVHPSDALLTIRQELTRPRDPATGRMIAFLDPWYRHGQEQSEWESVLGILQTARVENAVMAWYPKKTRKPRRRSFPLDGQYAQLRELAVHWAEMEFPGVKRKFSRYLGGCGLLWKNLPEMSEITAEVGREMQQGFKETENGRKLELQFQPG